MRGCRRRAGAYNHGVMAARTWLAAVVALGLEALTAAQGARPTFEVASVKLNEGTASGWSYGAKGQTFVITNLTLRRIIAVAYEIPLQVEQFRLVGGPDTLLARRFDIQARIPEGVPADRRLSMLRELLVDRFRLRVRAQVRQAPVYLLTVARDGTLGPELRRSEHNCSEYKAIWSKNNTPASEKVPPRDTRNRPLCVPSDDRPPLDSRQISDAGPISHLIASLGGVLDRPLLDGTQLRGNFEWRLTFKAAPVAVVQRPDSDDSASPSLPVAMRQQLGLQLEQRTGPIDVLVIDSVEMPTPN